MSTRKYDAPVLFAITTAAVALSQHVHIFWQTLWHTFYSRSGSRQIRQKNVYGSGFGASHYPLHIKV